MLLPHRTTKPKIVHQPNIEQNNSKSLFKTCLSISFASYGRVLCVSFGFRIAQKRKLHRLDYMGKFAWPLHKSVALIAGCNKKKPARKKVHSPSFAVNWSNCFPISIYSIEYSFGFAFICVSCLLSQSKFRHSHCCWGGKCSETQSGQSLQKLFGGSLHHA